MNDMSAPNRVQTQPTQPLRRVALLVDGENLSASQAGAILDAAATLGDLLIRRVYGKLSDLQSKGWGASHGFRLIPATTTKNSADLLLSIEAIELALDDWTDCIAIAAGDNDYTHVALKLRERGFPVYGLMTDGHRCADLRAAYWDVLPLAAVPVAAPCPVAAIPQILPAATPATKPPQVADTAKALTARIVKILQTHADPKGCPVPTLNTELRKQRPVKISDYPEKTWNKFLSQSPDKFILTKVGTTCHVLLKT